MLPSFADIEYFRGLSPLPAVESKSLSEQSLQVLRCLNTECGKWVQIHDICRLLNIVERSDMCRAIAPLIGSQAALFGVESEPDRRPSKPDPLGHTARYIDDGSMRWFHAGGRQCDCPVEQVPNILVPIASLKITHVGIALMEEPVRKIKEGHEGNAVRSAFLSWFCSKYQTKSKISDLCEEYVDAHGGKMATLLSWVDRHTEPADV